ncbi:hypothetical protein GJ629_00220 [Halapricum sp. CBA1109]|uniref:phage NrS-1 polymerase family protein n=1 Tax=Halapricum sp. CBA1109 TaxID=2668068 RepID=UPI0013B78EE9|nr:hypothetical protein [Halapricum sp. CBA1109]MUV88501.1 hypothetical protein [Halapricum sp. CBA1109]
MSLDTITEDTIPDTIRGIEQWICWREKDRDGKTTKIPTKPYRTSGSPNAKTDDPSHWRDFETALNYHRSGRIATTGIGFVFSKETEIVGVDLDSCRNPETGEFDKWAQDVIDRLDSFTEVSPSETGAHVLLKGRLPDGRNRRGDIEMYDEGRFFTVTGEHVEGTPLEIKRRQDSIVGVHLEYVQSDPDDGRDQLGESSTGSVPTDGNQTDTEHQSRTLPSANVNRGSKQSDIRRRFDTELPPIDDPSLEVALQGLPPQKVPAPVPQSFADIAGPGVPFDDIEVIEKAYNSKSGNKIQALYCGEASLYNTADSEYPSQSEADMALLFYLGFWTGKDPEQMERLFRDSGLYREKWDEQHYGNGATYGQVCLAKTLLELSDYYEPPESETSSREGGRPQTGSGHSLSSEEAENGRHHSPPLETPAEHSPSQRDQRNDETVSGGESAPSQQESYTDPGWSTSQRAPEATHGQRSGGSSSYYGSPYSDFSIDTGAVEDARRLAHKVTQQHERLTAQAAHIADLENRLYWYRQAFGVEPPVPPDYGGSEYASHGNSELEGFVELPPSGQPATAPAAGDTVSGSGKRAVETSRSSDHASLQADDGNSERTVSDANAESESKGKNEDGIDFDSSEGQSSSISAWLGRLRRFIP